MTPLEIKTLVATLLTAEIGTYTATDTGVTDPAIAILMPSNQEQGDRSVAGLEVVISYAPASSRNLKTSYETLDTNVIHKVSLIQHELSTQDYTLNAAVVKLQRRFINGYGSIVQVDRDSSALAEYTFLIPDSDLFPADRALR